MARILIIDDDIVCREMLKALLKKSRHEVFEATRGLDGIKIAGTTPADLIFLDVRIPEMDGFQVCKLLKSNPHTQHIPVIMLTGCSQDIQKEIGRQAGADEYVTKPWAPAQLMATVHRLLEKKSS
jgi:DNA-binding response OmpR family regulator